MKKNIEYFLLGGSITETYNSDGFAEALAQAKHGMDFQIATFIHGEDTVANFLSEVLGQDDFVVMTEMQYHEFLKLQH